MRSVPPPRAFEGEFEGASAEEALARAYAALGAHAPVRCWKVRRGGILGFFVRETYVAALHDPTGVSRGRGRGRDGGGDLDRPASDDRSRAPRRASPADRLAELVAATDDRVTIDHVVDDPALPGDATFGEVTLGAPALVDHAFREVLAQAQAALDAGGSAGYDTPAASREHPSGPSRDARPPSEDVRADLVDALGARVGALGVPAAYQPDEPATLDALTRSLAGLPCAAPLPRAGGSVVVVVGSRRDALATAQQVASALAIAPSDLLVAEQSVTQWRRIARRRATPRLTVLALEAPLFTRDLAATAAWLDRLAPDYVLGAVGAAAKRVDVARWAERLGHLDALALVRLRTTASVAELMGVAPILWLEGAPATTLRWLHVLLARLVEEEP
ncbi:MAG: hypothetical protein ACP5PB_09465 [Acidimicrobiales bacterium]